MNLVRANRSWNLDPWSNLRDEINRLFESPLAAMPETEFFNTWTPAVDLYEDKDSLIVQVEVPGMKKEEIEVSLHDGVLTIGGERREEKPAEGNDGYRAERLYGRFQRAITLPKPVDSANVKAAYKDGILTVTLPKSEEAKPRQISIS